jgi:hypothetical protein
MHERVSVFLYRTSVFTMHEGFETERRGRAFGVARRGGFLLAEEPYHLQHLRLPV